MITGDQLSTEERVWAGIDTFATVASMGASAYLSGLAKSGKSASTLLKGLATAGQHADDVNDVSKVIYATATGQDPTATMGNLVLGQAMGYGMGKATGYIGRRFGKTPSVDVDIDLPSSQRPKAMDLDLSTTKAIKADSADLHLSTKAGQAADLHLPSAKQVSTDGVATAVGVTKAADVEVPKGKPQVEAPTYNKEQILKNLEESRKAREASNFGEYRQKEKFQQTLLGMDEMDRQRYLQWHKYAEAGISPSDRVRVLEISENAPKVEYRAGVSQDSILNTTKGDRPNVDDVYKQSYIEAHQQQFKDGAARFQKFQPSEGWNNGIVGGDDGISFWLSKNHADIIQDVAGGDNRLYETLLGFDEGYLGDESLYRLDVSPEVVSERGISIPNGNEAGVNRWWRPGGRTYPGDMPEGVMSGISTKEGDHIWNIVN